jgi:hypothetical protein
MKDWKNKVINKELRGQKGNKFHVLAGKEVKFHARSIWLLSSDGEKPDYSLWIFEPTDEGKIAMWPYEGTDYNDLVKELLELFIETAFDE